MKKVISILAVVVVCIGLFSCEAENNVEETEALYENVDINATDDDGEVQSEGSGGN